MKRRFFLFSTTALGSTVALQSQCWAGRPLIAQAASPSSLSPQEAYEIGKAAYVYSFPLVVMELTRRISTSVPAPQPNAFAPVNQLGYFQVFPDASFRDVVRPNNDTLYGSAWIDISQEPMVVKVPDMGDRYYLLNVLNLWTDIVAAPSPRIVTSPGAKTYAIVGPNWRGTLPAGVEKIASTTNDGWFLSRILVKNAEDLPNVLDLYRQFELMPLSAYGQPYTPPRGAAPNPAWDITTPPLFQIRAMDARTFFTLSTDLLANNPPYPADAAMLEQMAALGIVPGSPFNWDALSPAVQQQLTAAVRDGLAEISTAPRSGTVVNGWTIDTNTAPGSAGRFGTDYLARAKVALAGLGANLTEDTVYPQTQIDGEERPLNGAYRYRIRFPAGQLPPVNAFWSLTMYDQDGFFVDNPLNRYLVNDRSNLTANADGSIEVYIQQDAPAEAQKTNWLPAPAGEFSLVMRLYWPKTEILNGNWVPPEVERLS